MRPAAPPEDRARCVCWSSSRRPSPPCVLSSAIACFPARKSPLPIRPAQRLHRAAPKRRSSSAVRAPQKTLGPAPENSLVRGTPHPPQPSRKSRSESVFSTSAAQYRRCPAETFDRHLPHPMGTAVPPHNRHTRITRQAPVPTRRLPPEKEKFVSSRG